METHGPPTPSSSSSKFAAYQNPAFSAALTAKSLRPSKSTLLFVVSLSSASAFSLLSTISRENGLIEVMSFGIFSQEVACSTGSGGFIIYWICIFHLQGHLFVQSKNCWRANNLSL
uniref:Uncharacterized protein n=1 Tax=Salix viminalis TaxID=40686 RepID=A0A6N2L6C2_SALVM